MAEGLRTFVLLAGPGRGSLDPKASVARLIKKNVGQTSRGNSMDIHSHEPTSTRLGTCDRGRIRSRPSRKLPFFQGLLPHSFQPSFFSKTMFGCLVVF